MNKNKKKLLGVLVQRGRHSRVKMSYKSYAVNNFNSGVCVVNVFEIYKDILRRNICAFYEDGGFKFVYSRHGGEFIPSGIGCDLLCNIICVNKDNTIHVVSSEGSFLKYLFTRYTCILNPSALSPYRGVLWLGS